MRNEEPGLWLGNGRVASACVTGKVTWPRALHGTHFVVVRPLPEGNDADAKSERTIQFSRSESRAPFGVRGREL